MRGALAVFVKTPDLSPVKARLAADIGREKADTFFYLAQAATEAVVQQLQSDVKSQGITLTPYWAVAEEAGLQHDLWSAFACLYTGGGGLGECLDTVYGRLLAKYDFVILLGMDSPQNTSANIQTAIHLLKQPKRLVIGPSEDGGFYLFAGNCPLPTAFWCDHVTYGAEQTLLQLTHNFQAMSSALSTPMSLHYLPSLRDVDDRSDLLGLLEDLAELPKEDCLSSQVVLKIWLQQLQSSTG